MSDDKKSEPTEKKIERRGGARKGSGRPSFGGTKRIYVPLALADGIEKIIEEYKELYKEKDKD